MPTIMKVYSNMQANLTLKAAIEFTCLQFYILHKTPFILQLFGSVAQILDFSEEENNVVDTNKVKFLNSF
jgi:protein unc-80